MSKDRHRSLLLWAGLAGLATQQVGNLFGVDADWDLTRAFIALCFGIPILGYLEERFGGGRDDGVGNRKDKN